MEKKKIIFVINPISGVGKQKTVEKAIERYLDKSKFEYEIKYTTHHKHAIEVSKNAADNKYDAVIAVGGDGSVNEIGQSLIDTDTAIGIIPAGSGNGLAHFIDIPFNVAKAIRVINKFKTIKIDTATINDYPFISIAGVGFDALIAKNFSKSKKRGFWPYCKLVAKDIFFFRPNRFKLYVDGRIIKRRALLVSFANSNQWGFNATIAPTASLTDGLLDVCIVRRLPAIVIPVLAVFLFLRLLDKTIYLEIIKASNIRIIQRVKHITQVDGEPLELTRDLNIRVKPLSLHIIVP